MTGPLGTKENRFTVTTGDGHVMLVDATADQVRDELRVHYGLRGYRWLQYVLIETVQEGQNVAFVGNFWLLHILATDKAPTFAA